MSPASLSAARIGVDRSKGKEKERVRVWWHNNRDQFELPRNLSKPVTPPPLALRPKSTSDPCSKSVLDELLDVSFGLPSLSVVYLHCPTLSRLSSLDSRAGLGWVPRHVLKCLGMAIRRHRYQISSGRVEEYRDPSSDQIRKRIGVFSCNLESSECAAGGSPCSAVLSLTWPPPTPNPLAWGCWGTRSCLDKGMRRAP